MLPPGWSSLVHPHINTGGTGSKWYRIMGEISPEVQGELQSRRSPLIQLTSPDQRKCTETAVTQLINEERQYLYQRERDFNHALMELALAGVGSSAIVHRLRELTGRNLGFIDLNYNPHFPLDPQLTNALKKQIHQAISKLRSESANVTTPVVGLNLIQQQAFFLGLIRVVREIKGYLMLLAPENNISEVDRLAVRAGTLALAVEMSRRQAVEETEARFESDIIEDLLSGDITTNNMRKLRGALI
jgi:hypothetical protein